MKCRRVGFIYLLVKKRRSNRLQKLAICHPPTDPTTFSASPTLPHSPPSSSLQWVPKPPPPLPLSALCPPTLRCHHPSSPPPLTAFTPLPLSPPGRPCCTWFGFSNLLEVFRGFQCVPTGPTALSASSTPFQPHSTSSPPLPPDCPCCPWFGFSSLLD